MPKPSIANANKDLSEWIETDGLGGFASGTVSGQRTRRYHGLLLVAQKPPAERVVLVNGMDVWAQCPAGVKPLSTQFYGGEVEAPCGYRHLESFSIDPWPTWRYRIAADVVIVKELFVPDQIPGVAIAWRVIGPRAGLSLHVRPLLSGRDFHALHHKNPTLDPTTGHEEDAIFWKPYPDQPTTYAQTNAEFREKFDWYNNFLYSAERDRGLDHHEDLFCPGKLRWDLTHDDAVLMLSADQPMDRLCGLNSSSPQACFDAIGQRERQRRQKLGAESQPVSAYMVRRGEGKSMIAGYPWFGDWGRDTFIALRGLCLTSPQRLDDAHQILLSWSDAVSEGMLPNRYPDRGETVEYNSVDASLWYIVAIQDSLAAHRRAQRNVSSDDIDRLLSAVDAILRGYEAGTRYGIRLDDDGLIAAGEPGVQLTWMDAKVDGWVVTPRIGKPVEIQALWFAALSFASRYWPRWQTIAAVGRKSFADKFWNDSEGYLYDVVDQDHIAGHVDASFRPNQIFAAGGLPVGLLDESQCRSVIQAVERRLLTPMGLRTLATDHPDYKPHYQGGLRERDAAYHQGTVWPWLIGPFVEAWLKIHHHTDAAKQKGRKRFLRPLKQHLEQVGHGHIAEICDGDAPHTPRGCPFQAWSLGEYLRIRSMLDK